jgi:excisionase family DNA binding protein
MERLLTPEEAARILAVSPKSVREWLRQGKLKGVKVGRLWRIRERDLEAFLDPALRALEAAPEKARPNPRESRAVRGEF